MKLGAKNMDIIWLVSHQISLYIEGFFCHIGYTNHIVKGAILLTSYCKRLFSHSGPWGARSAQTANWQCPTTWGSRKHWYLQLFQSLFMPFKSNSNFFQEVFHNLSTRTGVEVCKFGCLNLEDTSRLNQALGCWRTEVPSLSYFFPWNL